MLTRLEAARVLKCSESTVRRLEGDALTPIVDADGTHRFDIAEVLAAAALRTDNVEADRASALDARETIAKTFAQQADTVERLLKHIEVRETTQANAVKTVLEAQDGLVRSCFDRLEKLEAQRAETLGALEAAQLAHREHDLEEKKLEMQRWRAQELLAQLRQFGPILLQQIAGKKGSPVVPLDFGVLLRSVPPEQIVQALGSLGEEDLYALSELVGQRLHAVADAREGDKATADSSIANQAAPTKSHDPLPH